MRNYSLYQEILLRTTGTYFRKSLCFLKAIPDEHLLDDTSYLLQLVQMGVLDELLPGSVMLSAQNSAVILWDINVTQSFLWLNYGEERNAFNKRHSIDPYYIIHFACKN